MSIGAWVYLWAFYFVPFIDLYFCLCASTILSWWLWLFSRAWNQAGLFLQFHRNFSFLLKQSWFIMLCSFLLYRSDSVIHIFLFFFIFFSIVVSYCYSWQDIACNSPWWTFLDVSSLPIPSRTFLPSLPPLKYLKVTFDCNCTSHHPAWLIKGKKYFLKKKRNKEEILFFKKEYSPFCFGTFPTFPLPSYITEHFFKWVSFIWWV